MKCIVCGSKKFELVHKGTRDVEHVDVLCCLNCGGKQLSSFAHITNGFYEHSGMHQSQEITSLSQVKIEEDDRRRASLYKDIRGEILDFGCGGGGVLRLMSEYRNSTDHLHGVELEASMRTLLNGMNIQCKRRITEYSSELKFDLITMFHVIEHLTDPYEVLDNIRSRMSNGGELIIETPNGDDALLSLYHSKSFENFTYWGCHVFLYTSNSLEKLLHNAGFHINYSTQIQRYPLSNHLYWLSKNNPGGHSIWEDMNTEELEQAYYKVLKEKKMCDTLYMSVSKR